MERALNEIRVRPASEDDLETVLDVLGEAALWVAARGFDNWPARFPSGFIVRSISAGHVHVVEISAQTVATISLQWDDPMFRGPMPPDAGYVHRLAVRTREHVAGIGHALLDWAAEQVAGNGRQWLRLDIAADNRPLRQYYERAGFSHERDAHGEFTLLDGAPKAWHTSLYQRRVIAHT
jgi:ribosomal protein S18 acetylase RimI-like enzyme